MFPIPPGTIYIVLPTIQHHFVLNLATFLSVCSPILFLGTIMSKSQYTTMAPDFHLILTVLWVEKRFCNTSWGLIYYPNNGTTLFHAVVCYFLGQRSKNLVCGYRNIQGSMNNHVTSCSIELRFECMLPSPFIGYHNVQDSMNIHETRVPPHYNLPIDI